MVGGTPPDYIRKIRKVSETTKSWRILILQSIQSVQLLFQPLQYGWFISHQLVFDVFELLGDGVLTLHQVLDGFGEDAFIGVEDGVRVNRHLERVTTLRFPMWNSTVQVVVLVVLTVD